jgi:hypothetical protein
MTRRPREVDRESNEEMQGEADKGEARDYVG